MKHLLRIICLLLSPVLVPGVALKAAQEAVGASQVVIENPVHDVGRVPEGMVLTHDFRVLNRGIGVLEIMKVSPD